LPRLYRYLEASPTLLITPAQARSLTFNKLAELRLTIGTTHLFYFFALDVPCLQAELEMFAKNTLDSFKLFRCK
jgi:hypothetical protein